MQRGIFTAKSLSREAHAAYDDYARRPRSPLASDSRAFNGASRRLLASLLTTPMRLQSCLQLADLRRLYSSYCARSFREPKSSRHSKVGVVLRTESGLAV